MGHELLVVVVEPIAELREVVRVAWRTIFGVGCGSPVTETAGLGVQAARRELWSVEDEDEGRPAGKAGIAIGPWL